MKKIFLLTTLALIAVIGAYAQKSVMLNAYGAYVFDDKFDTYYSSNVYLEGKIRGGFQWGAGIEVKLREDTGVELIYFRQDTEAPIHGGGFLDNNIDLGINYIMLAGVRYLPVNSEKFEPYAGLMLGMAIYSNKNPEYGQESSATKFAWGFRLGSNIWVSEKVGIKIQGLLLSSVQAAGGGLYFGTGGAGAGVSSYSTLYQFGLGGGLVFRVK
jgi:hypothetical protein